MNKQLLRRILALCSAAVLPLGALYRAAAKRGLKFSTRRRRIPARGNIR